CRCGGFSFGLCRSLGGKTFFFGRSSGGGLRFSLCCRLCRCGGFSFGLCRSLGGKALLFGGGSGRCLLSSQPVGLGLLGGRALRFRGSVRFGLLLDRRRGRRLVVVAGSQCQPERERRRQPQCNSQFHDDASLFRPRITATRPRWCSLTPVSAPPGNHG